MRQGWAVPTPTDIAFAVGVLALLGKRVDPALRVLLLALAIADDIAAILVIAFVYAQASHPLGLGFAAAGVAGVAGAAKAPRRALAPYSRSAPSSGSGLLQAGLHPVLAGVISDCSCR